MVTRIMKALWFLLGAPILVIAYMSVAGYGYSQAGMSASSASIGSSPSVTDLFPLLVGFYMIFSAGAFLFATRQTTLRLLAIFAHLPWLGVAAYVFTMRAGVGRVVFLFHLFAIALSPWYPVWILTLLKRNNTS